LFASVPAELPPPPHPALIVIAAPVVVITNILRPLAVTCIRNPSCGLDRSAQSVIDHEIPTLSGENAEDDHL